MKRPVLALACLILAAPLVADKAYTVFPHATTGAAPATVTIASAPLTIVIGGDTSMQVYNANVPGTGQYYPPNCGPGQTADMGVFAAVGATLYGPDFADHPCGSAAIIPTPWTPVAISPVTGTGTGGDPFTVVVTVTSGAGLNLVETVTYVAGAPGATISLVFSEQAPPSAGQGGIGFDAFMGADLYLADNDDGIGLKQGNSIGGRAADLNCLPLQYVILFGGTTPPNRYVADSFGTVWSEIAALNLSNTIDQSCQDNGAALQWTGLVVSGPTTATIGTGISFTGNAAPLATVPTLSTVGLAALVLMLAVVGYVLVRRTSLGA